MRQPLTKATVGRKIRLGLLMSSSSRLGGGVFEAVLTHATSMLATDEVEPLVFAVKDRFTESDRERWQGMSLTTPRAADPLVRYAPGLVGRMLEADLDVLHLHGIWQYPSLAGASWAKRSGKPYLISPHGMLEPWILSRGRFKKALARIAYEQESWSRATLFHGLTEAEAESIRAIRPEARVEVVPNGISPSRSRAGKGPARRFLYLGRIHPKKNLAALIEAWCDLSPEIIARDLRLTIVGWGDPQDVQQLERQIARAGDQRIEMLGPRYGEEKASLLASSRFVVLPSLSEGLPMAILEAWAAGVPTLMSDQCNLPIGFSEGAALRTGTETRTITETLRRAIALDDDAWRGMSASALRLALGMYSPEAVTGRWVDIYKGLLARPEHR